MPRPALVLVAIVLAAFSLAGAAGACGGQSASSGQAAPSGGVLDKVKGAEMYAEFCAGCHGSDGSGGGGGPAVTGQSDAAQVEAVVRDGTGSMPGFTDEMSADQITAVAGYLVSELQ
jgi:mono/diheme cytochrome c family protein